MSNFNKKGYRKDQIRQQVEHLNQFYKILENLEDLFQEIINSNNDVSPDNIGKLASEITGREMDSTELFVLKGKLKAFLNEQEDNDTEHI